MASRKTSNLQIVNQQTAEQAELQAQRKHESEEQKKREQSWKLTRQEIADRVRNVRLELETYRDRLEGMPFDVVTGDVPRSVDYINSPFPADLADMFNPCVSERFEWLYERSSDKDELFNLKVETAETAFQIGVLAGAMFAGCSNREIKRLERGLVHATVSRSWRVKEVRRGN